LKKSIIKKRAGRGAQVVRAAWGSEFKPTHAKIKPKNPIKTLHGLLYMSGARFCLPTLTRVNATDPNCEYLYDCKAKSTPLWQTVLTLFSGLIHTFVPKIFCKESKSIIYFYALNPSFREPSLIPSLSPSFAPSSKSSLAPPLRSYCLADNN
jgi:hypothetical protein